MEQVRQRTLFLFHKLLNSENIHTALLGDKSKSYNQVFSMFLPKIQYELVRNASPWESGNKNVGTQFNLRGPQFPLVECKC